MSVCIIRKSLSFLLRLVVFCGISTLVGYFKPNPVYISIWLIDWTLTGPTTSGQSSPGSNGNEGVLHIPQSSRTEASSSDDLVSYSGHFLEGVLPLCRVAVGLFPSQQDTHVFFWGGCLTFSTEMQWAYFIAHLRPESTWLNWGGMSYSFAELYWVNLTALPLNWREVAKFL